MIFRVNGPWYVKNMIHTNSTGVFQFYRECFIEMEFYFRGHLKKLRTYYNKIVNNV